MSFPEEAAARELYAHLLEVGSDVRLEGEGVHWHVRLTAPPRGCVVDCFVYPPAPDLVLGPNPKNARASGRPTFERKQGVEYHLVLGEHGARVAGGRTQDRDVLKACVRRWLDDRVSFDELQREWPFVDQTRRRMREIGAELAPLIGDHARWVIEAEIGYELWVYGEGRSCQIHPPRGALAFHLGQQQVAFAEGVASPAREAARWVVDRPTLDELARILPGVRVERHAELLARGEHAAWHWAFMRERMADPGDVLFRMRGLVERMLARPTFTRFFTFTSLTRLCFSASSHFPWVNRGLPPVDLDEEGRVWIGDQSMSEDEALSRLEELLASYPVEPFFGSAPHHELPILERALVEAGSDLRPVLRQRRQWFGVVIERGDRACRVGFEDRSLGLHEGPTQVGHVRARTSAGLIAALSAWVERREPFEHMQAAHGAEPRDRRFSFDPD